ISARGDSPRYNFEASYGKTLNNDRTDVSLFASHAGSTTPRVGQRNFETRDRQVTFANAPQDYISTVMYGNKGGNGLTIFNYGDSNLVFKPQYGGSTLPSGTTFLPARLSGTTGSALTAILTQYSGQMNFDLSDDDARADLGSNPQTNSLLANVRHRFD